MSYEDEARSANKTLLDRGNIYGPYGEGLDIRESIMNAIKNGYSIANGKDMPQRYESYFLDIANKLCRLAVSPSHTDSWHDIAGYASLIESTIKDFEKPKPAPKSE